MYPTVIQTNNLELKDRVLQSLRLRGICPAESVRIHVSGGVATISGWHASPQDRDALLDCCRHVAGIVRVVDASAVRRDDAHPIRRPARSPEPKVRAESKQREAVGAYY